MDDVKLRAADACAKARAWLATRPMMTLTLALLNVECDDEEAWLLMNDTVMDASEGVGWRSWRREKLVLWRLLGILSKAEQKLRKEALCG